MEIDLSHMNVNESEAVEDDPGDDDPFEPCPGLLDCSAGAGKVHHQERHGRGDDGCDSRDGEDLRVDILHDLARFLPNGGR